MGPLNGITVIEIASIGPGPFCGMMLADMGADVIRVERKDARSMGKYDVLARGRRSITVDLKRPEGVEIVLKLIDGADALFEGFRPGVMEKLGLGPDVCLARKPRLVYGRMTGWGQDGPLAQAAGHDINYIALTGALHAIGRPGERPAPPLNLVGDFGGGGMYLAFGIVCAVLEAQRSGKGQVVDAAMTDGSAALMAMMYGFKAMGMWTNEHGTNMLDGGAPFYDTYECADGKWIAVGSVEPQFYKLLLEKVGLDGEPCAAQMDKRRWPQLKETLAATFKTKPRDEWSAIMENTDVCFAPVLDFDEAPAHPHNVARGTFVTHDGVTQPAPAPRFSRTQVAIRGPVYPPGSHSDELLTECGFDAAAIETLRTTDVI